jgi:hypothetical protein
MAYIYVDDDEVAAYVADGAAERFPAAGPGVAN